MTDTAEKIIGLFRKIGEIKPGMVLSVNELVCDTGNWDLPDLAGLDEAKEELRDGGYVIVTPAEGMELTERGYRYLLGESGENDLS